MLPFVSVLRSGLTAEYVQATSGRRASVYFAADADRFERSVTIEPCAPGDVPAAIELVLNVYLDTADGRQSFPREEDRHRMKEEERALFAEVIRKEQEHPETRLYIARDKSNKEIIGFGMFNPFESPTARPGERGLKLHFLFVKTERQGQGIGLGLMRALFAEASRLAYTAMYIHTHRALTDAMRLYQGLGFTEVTGRQRQRLLKKLTYGPREDSVALMKRLQPAQTP